MEDKTILLSLALSMLLAILLSKLVSISKKPRLNLPPGPWTLPVIGSIHHLASNPNTHRALRALSQKHGPLMQLWLGEVPAVVASTPEAAREILRNQDLRFADRHVTSTVATVSFDASDIFFSPYGERWRQLRKLCTQELLTATRVRSFVRPEQKEGGTPIPITNEIIVVLLFDMFSGGSETSATVMIWIMAELIRWPRVMTKVQAEVRQALQGKVTVTEDDIVGLNYLKMVIKETLRLHCPGPLLVPHRCRETCKVMGYDVLKGTCVFVNVWALGRDPKYWEDPEEFKPERFENSDMDYKGNTFEYLPFGSGRRICPGINLGIANIELPLASLLYHFDWKLPDEMASKDLDMQEALGMSRDLAAVTFSPHTLRLPDPHRPPPSSKMKFISAYLLATLAGNPNPSAEDLTTILESVGAEVDHGKMELLLSQLAGKDITEIIASGREKFASVPCGGGGVAVAAAAPAAGDGAAPQSEAKKEEKVEEKEESDDDMGFSLFD
uniref:Uncharacterized protein n=2 Tax=Oryza TaxID=4527 RepID=A0A0D3F5X5_9ORYZ